MPSDPRQDRRIERNLGALRLEPGRHNLDAIEPASRAKEGRPESRAHTDDPRIQRADKGCQSPAPARSSAQVAGHHSGVQRQDAAATELSGEPASQSQQPALHIVSVGVKVQSPSLPAHGAALDAETQPGAIAARVQNAAREPRLPSIAGGFPTRAPRFLRAEADTDRSAGFSYASAWPPPVAGRDARSREPSARSRRVRPPAACLPDRSSRPGLRLPAARPMAAASAAESRGGTSRPLTPSSMTSGLPPTLVATTGTPAAIDSSRVFESPSLRDGSTEIAASDSSSGTSVRNPVNTIRWPKPQAGGMFFQFLLALRHRRPRGNARPEIVAARMTAASRKYSTPFIRLRRENTTTRRGGGRQSQLLPQDGVPRSVFQISRA